MKLSEGGRRSDPYSALERALGRRLILLFVRLPSLQYGLIVGFELV
jgi:hypothetical protein